MMRMCVSAEIVSGYLHPLGYPDSMRPSLSQLLSSQQDNNNKYALRTTVAIELQEQLPSSSLVVLLKSWTHCRMHMQALAGFLQLKNLRRPLL
ncbi:hypothetical protein PGTUg99_006082 [Puccinia graminis f. sp. tritici]|uniref:Uncharacterized protein n=1 Tax=Puccinia graminis f. sp. tritici TaxID=56615 RepID=A0A5B0QZ34_PUCGR|nr:hypothetical protein PGTUg99_006082 [Puccinia graminis f. sp. tritici]